MSACMKMDEKKLKKIKNSDERLKSYSTRLPSSESGCRLRL